MRKTIILVISITLVMLACSSASSQPNRLLQTTTRSASYTKMCASFADRDALVDEKAKADAKNNQAAMKGAFKVSGNELFSAAVADSSGILAGLLAQAASLYTDLGLFVGPFALGLVITLLIWPFLCCCCCCPSCCPSKCCQKPETEQYTKCELFWPATVLILAFLLLLVASVIGITKAGDIENSYKAVACSAAITFDDLLNGNTASTGNFFIGFNGMVNSLAELDANLGDVQTQLDNLKYSDTAGAVRLAYDEGTSLLADLSSVPDNTVGGALAPFSYDHFDGSGTPGAVDSLFPDILGTADTTSPSGAMNISYYTVNLVNENLRTVADGAQAFIDGYGTISSVVTQLSDSITQMTDLVSGFDTNISNIDDSISGIMKIVTLAVTAFFGVFIGFAVLGIVGTLLMTCCEKFSCRYLLYFLCVILLLLGFLSFLLSLFFSIFTPILYLGCDFLTVAISSSAGFTANLGNAIGGQFSSYLSVCLPGGSGDIINQLDGVDLSALNGMNDAIAQMNAFDVAAIQSGVDTALTGLQDKIDKYYYTDEFDFSSSYDKSFMAKIANPTRYSSCTASTFQTDSWVPSIRQNDINCPSAISGTTATDTDCPADTDIQGSVGTCRGCMDTTKIIDNTGTFLGDISTRYTGCTDYIADMTLLYNNYYVIKKGHLDDIKARMDAVVASYNTATTGYRDLLGDVGTVFTNAITALTAAVSTVVDPNQGMIAGLNCLLLGEDINLIVNTTCNKLFNTFYFLRLTLGISAFGILFSLCCTTCSGVRAFKHSTRKGAVLPKELGGDQQQSTMNALNHPK